jgi:hypothetical protein
MNTRLIRRPASIHPQAAQHAQSSARPVRFVLAGLPPGTARQQAAPPGALPAVTELASIVREQIGQLYPGLPREALDGAAGQGARQALAMALASPQAAAVLNQLALQAARSIISLYLALAEQRNLRPVA